MVIVSYQCYPTQSENEKNALNLLDSIRVVEKHWRALKLILF